MNKSRLPKDWIVVNSKSHPDRVYYFNVKTNQSSWDEPAAENTGESTSEAGGNTRRRRKSVKQSRPTTPEPDESEKISPNRKKLIARRSVKPVEQNATQENETPQMRALREKMLQKKEKGAPSKSGTNTQGTKKKQAPSKKSVNEDQCLASTSESNTIEQEGFTPQMKAIFEKMKQKGPKGSPKVKVKKAEHNNNKVAEVHDKKLNEVEEPIKSRRARSQAISTRRSVSVSSATSCEEIDQHEQAKPAATEKVGLRKRVVSDALSESSSKKGRKSIYKKNLGKERMEKLRNSLELEKKFKSPNSSDKNRPISLNNYEAPPSLYKNVTVRLVRLKDRLSLDKVPTNKSTAENTPRPSRQSQSASVTTVDDLVQRAHESSYCEEMDWEPMEDEEITYEVQAVRTQLYAGNNPNVMSSVPNNIITQPLALEPQEKRQLYIVVDTNVFLTNIGAIEKAKDSSFKKYDRPIIVVPYTVIRELDYIKDDRHKTRQAALRMKARRAVHYINTLFSSKHPRVTGQTPEDVAKNKEKFATDCPDDEILQTCLQIRDVGKSVVLLSYDKNLCNKAMIYDLVTLGRDDPLEKIDYLNVSNNGNLLHSTFNSQDVDEQDLELTSILNHETRIADEVLAETEEVLKEFLTVIVSKDMRGLYGEHWENYVIVRPPWTVLTVLQCAIKHWIAAVSESFTRKAENLLKELLQIFNNRSGSGKRLRDATHVLDKCHDLTQMVNLEKHSDLMLRVSQKIDELRKQLLECEIQINERELRDAIGVEENIEAQQRRAEKAFAYFDAAYAYSRDMCGLAAEAVGMPCNIPHEIPNPLPSLDYVKQIQPELAANVNRLLHNLSAVMEQTGGTCIDHRALINLYHTLISFVPETTTSTEDLSPLDVYCCIKQKAQALKAGVRQLQDLGTHFCRLATYRCT